MELPNKYAAMAPSTGYWPGFRTTQVKPAKDGFIIYRVSHYAAVERIKFTYGLNGTLKAKGINETNYRPAVRFTEYFHNGVQITQKEYKALQRLEEKD